MGGLRDLANLVQEDRTPVGELKAADPAFRSAGEGAFLVAEEFAFEERFGERAHIYCNEGLGTPRAQAVDGARNKFFAGARFPFDQHRARDRCDLFDFHQHFAHRVGVAVEPGLFGEAAAFEECFDVRGEFVGAHRFGEHVVEAHAFESGFELRVADVGQPQDGRAAPELGADQGERLWVEQIPREDNHIGAVAADRGADVVHGGAHHGADTGRLKQCVEADGGFDVGERDEDGHVRHLGAFSDGTRSCRTGVRRSCQ